MIIADLIKSLFSFAAPYLAFGVLAILTAVSIFRTAPESDRKFLIYVFALSMIIRCYMSILLTNIAYMDDHNGFVSGDDRLYSLTALDIIKDIKAGTFQYKLVWFGMNLYTYILAVFYSVFGFKLAASKFINCYIGAMIPIMAYFISARIADRRVGRLVSVICALYPSFIFWSTHNLKEPLMSLLLCVGVWLLIKAISRGLKTFDVLIFMIFSFMILNLQLMYGYLIGMIALVVFYSYCSKTFRRIGAISLAAIAFVILWREGISLKFILQAEHHQWDMAIAGTTGYRIYTNNFLENLTKGHLDIPAFIAIYLKGAAYFLFSPFPWRIQTLGQFFVLPQIVAWYALFAFSLIGAARTFKTKPSETIALISFMTIGVSIWALTEGNVGAAFRHRDHFSAIIFIFAAIGIQNAITKAGMSR